MKLQLKRPLAFIDIEATGLNVEKDRIVELSVCKVFQDGSRETRTRRFNPEMPIPAESTAIHGINDDDVKDCNNFQHTAKGLHKFLDGCDIAGFASNRFDVPMLYFEFLRAGIEWEYTSFSMVDAGNIFKIKEERTLSAACKFYLGRDHEGAHGAEADVTATADVLLAQLERYGDIPSDVEELALFSNYGNRVLDLSGKFTYDENARVIFNFGAYRGKLVSENIDYVHWMLTKDFAPDTMKVCYELIQGQQDY